MLVRTTKANRRLLVDVHNIFVMIVLSIAGGGGCQGGGHVFAFLKRHMLGFDWRCTSVVGSWHQCNGCSRGRWHDRRNRMLRQFGLLLLLLLVLLVLLLLGLRLGLGLRSGQNGHRLMLRRQRLIWQHGHGHSLGNDRVSDRIELCLRHRHRLSWQRDGGRSSRRSRWYGH